MLTVGNSQKSGMSQGCGYEDRPSFGGHSRRKSSKRSSDRRPSKNARAYTPGDAWPWNITKSPGWSPSLPLKKWLKPTSYRLAAEA